MIYFINNSPNYIMTLEQESNLVIARCCNNCLSVIVPESVHSNKYLMEERPKTWPIAKLFSIFLNIHWLAKLIGKSLTLRHHVLKTLKSCLSNVITRNKNLSTSQCLPLCKKSCPLYIFVRQRRLKWEESYKLKSLILNSRREVLWGVNLLQL